MPNRFVTVDDQFNLPAPVRAQLAATLGSGSTTALIADADNPGLYLLPVPNTFAPDPDNPGLYFIGGTP